MECQLVAQALPASSENAPADGHFPTDWASFVFSVSGTNENQGFMWDFNGLNHIKLGRFVPAV
jgi:hypothetical protein